MIAYADATSWSGVVAAAITLLAFASSMDLIVGGPSCDPKIQKGCVWKPLTIAMPWAFRHVYRRMAGRLPPVWAPWAFTFAVYFLAAAACLPAVGRLAQAAVRWCWL